MTREGKPWSEVRAKAVEAGVIDEAKVAEARAATEKVIAKHRESHEQRGTTMAVYFPPECSWEVMEEITDKIAAMCYGIDRDNWDPFVFGRGGDCKLVPEESDG